MSNASAREDDTNGNMIRDLDRDIVTIKYNLLNLPDTIQFKSGHQILNTYDASGRKLKSVHVTNLNNAINPIDTGAVYHWTYNPAHIQYSGTAYVDDIEYSISKEYVYQYGGYYIDRYSLNRINNPEGYTDDLTDYRSSTRYNYYRRDYLGNNREVWKAPRYNYTGLENAQTVQQTQYYPSGLPWAYNTLDNLIDQPYRYGGKEFVEMHGLDEYDFHARGYFPAVARFTTIDPLTEIKPWQSPYMYCSGNMVNRIDPTGMIDDQVLPEITVTAKKPESSNNYDQFFRQLLSLSNKKESSIPQITPIAHPLSSMMQTAKMMNNIATINKDTEKKNRTLDNISIALAAAGISADAVEIYTATTAGKTITYVTLKGATAAVNTTKVISVLKGISNATIVVGVLVDTAMSFNGTQSWGKTITNTGVTIVAAIIGATVGSTAGLVIGGGYLVLDQMGAFNRPANIPYHPTEITPQDNTKVVIPYINQ